ncbi:MAG: putative glycoside hydrolase [Candidatus Vogelbacteria bacterium]
MVRVTTRSTSPAFIAISLLLAVLVAGSGYLFFVRPLFDPPLQYAAVGQTAPNPEAPIPAEPVITHLPTPEPVKAIYMTSWVAGTPRIRERLIKLIDETELNAIVIDIKDYTGRIAFAVADPDLVKTGAVEERIKDIKNFIRGLHEKNIYVIGRVSVFQDAYFVSRHPELAVHRKSDNSAWKDRKGISWLEAGATPVWDYVIKIAREAYAVGFDEINFDYIRFPSDGNMKDISYQHFDQKKETRAQVLKRFYSYLSQALAPLEVPISADLFGLVTTSNDDLGIGQVLVDAAPYFDYIAPMVYPSHFASGYLNFSKPAIHPYEVVKNAMTSAVARLIATSSVATSTDVQHSVSNKVSDKRRGELRPWLQDFNLGATYTAPMVRAQIQATYDSGLTSWMLWSPSNNYTRGALQDK